MDDEAVPTAKRPRLENDSSADEERKVLLSSLSKLTESLESVVEEGKREWLAAGGVANYIDIDNPRGIKLMFKPMPVFAECISKQNVSTWNEFEAIVKKHYKDEGVKDAFEELVSAEESYEAFILKLEKELVALENGSMLSEKDLLTVGKLIPKDLTLMDAQSGDSRSLHSFCSKSKYTLFILMRHYG